jgi:hypothetical protein
MRSVVLCHDPGHATDGLRLKNLVDAIVKARDGVQGADGVRTACTGYCIHPVTCSGLHMGLLPVTAQDPSTALAMPRGNLGVDGAFEWGAGALSLTYTTASWNISKTGNGSATITANDGLTGRGQFIQFVAGAGESVTATLSWTLKPGNYVVRFRAKAAAPATLTCYAKGYAFSDDSPDNAYLSPSPRFTFSLTADWQIFHHCFTVPTWCRGDGNFEIDVFENMTVSLDDFDIVPV